VIAPVASTTAICNSSYLIPLAEAYSDVPGRGPICERAILPTEVFDHQSATEEMATSGSAPLSKASASVIRVAGLSSTTVKTCAEYETTSAVAVPPPARLNVTCPPATGSVVGAAERVII